MKSTLGRVDGGDEDVGYNVWEVREWDVTRSCNSARYSTFSTTRGSWPPSVSEVKHTSYNEDTIL